MLLRVNEVTQPTDLLAAPDGVKGCCGLAGGLEAIVLYDPASRESWLVQS
jgi:hypothetical protein